MSTTDIQDIIDFIADVDATDFAGIERIRQAVTQHPAANWTRTPQRRRGRGIANEAGFTVGQTLKFAGQISPGYLKGKTVVVQNTNAKSVVVDCPDQPEYGRFAGKSNVRCPNSVVVAV